MKNFFSVIVFSLSLIFSAQAQTPKGMGSSDPAAKKILDGVSARFKSFKSVQSNFTLKIENASGKLMGNKTGTVYMLSLIHI